MQTKQIVQKLKPLVAAHRLKYHKVRFYDYQWRIWEDVLTALLDSLAALSSTTFTEEDIEGLKSLELGYEYTRQSGKTTTMTHIVEEIMIYVTKLYGMPIYIGIFAPQKEQAKTDFDRLKLLLDRSRGDLIVVDGDANRKAKEESNSKTLVLGSGSSCYISPVTPASKPESKTLHLILLEESQDLNDKIVNESIMPMVTSTAGPIVRVGTAGIVICEFYLKIQSGEVHVLKWREIVADRRRMYEHTGEAKHLIYEQTVKGLIDKYGEHDDRVRRPYNNEWLLEAGMYIPLQDLIRCRVVAKYERPMDMPGFAEYLDWYRAARRTVLDAEAYATQHHIQPGVLRLFRAWTEQDHYFGLDTAKSADQTVLKVGRMINGVLTTVLSIELRGINYQDQFNIIIDVLKWFNVAAGAIDSTGQGDFMPDLFERHTGYRIYRIKFSLMTKDVMYKSWYDKLINKKFAYYWQDPVDHEGEPTTAESARQFEVETSMLQKEYKQSAGYMSVHHPDSKDAHDDHPDSSALMNHAYDQYNVNSGILDYYAEQVADDRAKKEAEA